MFITLEGLDGSGKSTLAKGLVEHYGHPQTQTFGQPWSNKPNARQPEEDDSFLKDFFGRAKAAGGDPYGLGMLVYMTMDRFLDPVVQGIQVDPYPGWEQLTILDRYIDSTTAYQAASLSTIDGDLARWVKILDQFQRNLFPTPDLTLYLDAGLAGLERAQRDVREILGGDRKHQAVRVLNAYTFTRELPWNRDRFVVLDATQPPEQVLAQAIATIDKVLHARS